MAASDQESSKGFPFEAFEIYSETEGSDPDSGWDDSKSDPGYDILEETDSKVSALSIDKKANRSSVDSKIIGYDRELEEMDLTAPGLDEEDEKNFEQVQKIIKAGLLEKLKINQCKLYLRKYGLRLTGKKDALIQRIKEHLEIINGGAEQKYPASSFVLNCKGDACTGDVVLFEQNVYEMFNIASRGGGATSCGKRIVAGRIVRESYGAAKQQHTFTIEVLWSKGEKPLPPLHPLLIKGRNLYRLKTMRQRWDDEGERHKILEEKHSRGSLARESREVRMQEKENRRLIMENRVSKRQSRGKHSQSHSSIAKSQYKHQESNVHINSVMPAFPSQNSGLSVNMSSSTSQVQLFGSYAGTEKSRVISQWCGMPPDSIKVAMEPQLLGRSIDFGKPSFPGQLSDFSFERVEVARKPHQQKSYPGPNTNSLQTSLDQFGHRKPYDTAHAWRDEHSADYRWPNTHSIAKQAPIEKYPGVVDKTWFTEKTTNQRQPLTNVNHFLPLVHQRKSYKQNQLCRHFVKGRCSFGESCKFSHDLRESSTHQ
ncbi:hypothetical protein L6164_004179 [Bauhinia variegata]|uniref:Uncharacterized protein n=1 Tax=Bauhinia variegata TaxID=167791 RepID=A0ACB9Q922_BAUVA|nr:hypothetical protein L6164_004179 [Bauhinia variegata]